MDTLTVLTIKEKSLKVENVLKISQLENKKIDLFTICVNGETLQYNYANEKAGELALKAKEISKKNVLIAGSLPAQNDTYVLDQRDKKIIEKAKTIFKVIDKNSEASLLELKPITGRKHQLRKQLYAIGNPIFGDTKYKLSNSNKGINKNLMLHSYQIKFKINDIKHTYSALLPDYFKKLLKSKRLRFSNLK